MSLGTLLSEARESPNHWGFNHFLSAEVISFYANTTVKKFAYGVTSSLGEI